MNNSEWAHVLLKFAYSHIDGVLLRKEQPEDFYVPRFTYINVALCRAQGSDKEKVFLIEDLISESLEGKYIKYVHNSRPKPSIFAEEWGGVWLQNANFLCFLQHVQFEKTSHLAFILDFQGAYWSRVSYHNQNISHLYCRRIKNTHRSPDHDGQVRNIRIAKYRCPVSLIYNYADHFAFALGREIFSRNSRPSMSAMPIAHSLNYVLSNLKRTLILHPTLILMPAWCWNKLSPVSTV